VKKLLVGLIVAILAVGTTVVAQDTQEWLGHMVYRQFNPTVTHRGTMTHAGVVGGHRRVVISASSGTTALTAAQSGALVANTGTSGTTTFTLPVAATGLNFCFVEAGDAGGELLINPGTGVDIIGKTQPSETGTGIDTADGTGIKNTAATNVKGDFVCLTALDATTWHMTAQAGVWASQ
jgi:hypothetical protein